VISNRRFTAAFYLNAATQLNPNRSEKHGLGAGLSAVTALSPTRVYAVGGGSLVLRWNGSSWTRESIPSSAGSLWDVAALGPSTVWAVGQRVRTNGASGTSIVRTTNG
jgi:hypothetical protein